LLLPTVSIARTADQGSLSHQAQLRHRPT